MDPSTHEKRREIYTNEQITLLGMIQQLRIQRIRNLAHDQHRQRDDLLRVERWERAEEFIRTDESETIQTDNERGSLPRVFKQCIPHTNQLRDNTEDIQMRTVRKEEIPQMQHFR